MKVRKEKDFISCFSKDTGFYFRTGIIENGMMTEKDPFMSSFPELLDVGIMGHCEHGKTGLCLQSGVQCYQNGNESSHANMSLEDFRRIVSECKSNTFQIALGGCGDPDQHEKFQEILEACAEVDIVPNFTTSGFGMTKDIAKVCQKYCGAVAVSWYRSKYTYAAISMLIEAGVKTNIHYVLMKDTIEEAIELLKEERIPTGINAVIFLLHKPVGLGLTEQIIDVDNLEFVELIDYINSSDFPFKIGFDSCTVPALIGENSRSKYYLDTCEAARWSAYISSDMKIMPCSFDNQKQKWSIDLREYTIKEAWNSNAFNGFRRHFYDACPGCEKREECMGGCPICPEIILCASEKKTMLQL